MKNLSATLAKITAVVACVLTLGSCSRAEYAMLPKSSSYHGVTRASTPVPAAPIAAETRVAPAPVVAPTVAATPATRVAAAPNKTTAHAPKALPGTAAGSAVAAAPAASAAVATTSQAAPAPKLSLVQRLAVAKVTKKLEKAVQKSGIARQHDNTAATQKLSGKLRQGIILVLIGVLVEILAAAIGSSLVYLLGAILILIGLVLIVLYLLDEL